VKMVSELKALDPDADPLANPLNTSTQVDKFLQDYTDKSVPAGDLYPQSAVKDHVKEFLAHSTYGARAVFKYGPGLQTGFDTWDNTYRAIFDELTNMSAPAKNLSYASVAMNELLIATDEYGGEGSFNLTAPTSYFHSHNISIMAWTFDAWHVRSCYAAGTVDSQWRWFHGQCLSEGKFYRGECADGAACNWMVHKDADELLILHALFKKAKVVSVFSEWSATVSQYVSCVKKRPADAQTRQSQASHVTAADAFVGRLRCMELLSKDIRQTSTGWPAAACSNVTITVKLATTAPLFQACQRQ
jgi:hypothetical protein